MVVVDAQPDPSAAGGLPGPPATGGSIGHSNLLRERANPLGAYLRARREQVSPQQVGLPVSGGRRVPGLRREELAMLAGISADYYLRLERGRDRNPSAQVIEALARALQLDRDHVSHLVALASAPSRAVSDVSEPESVPDSALRLLDVLEQPAFIEDPYFTVLAANSSAQGLNPRLVPGRNQIRDLFLNRDEQALHPDWERAAACLTAGLRSSAGSHGSDPRFLQLTDELSRTSHQFRQLWARHDVRAQRGATVRLTHPQAGSLTLNREQLGINGTGGIKLVILYSADDSGAAAVTASGVGRD